MGSSYNKKMIWDYINGHYVENIDKLENDYKFMMDVISITRDKNLYNLCSDDIKKNYEFVKFMINTFSDDKKFVKEIAVQYLKVTNNEDTTYKELIFILCDIYEKDKEKDEYLIYFIKRAAIVTCERILINSIIEEEKDINIKKLYGKGFILYQTSEFGRSNVMIKYIAKILLEEIFYEDSNLSIEELIHKRFSSLDKLDRYGIKNFIFTYVSDRDSYLATYLSTNIEVISDIEKKIRYIRNNWDNYIDRNLMRKNEIFMQEAFHLIDEYNSIYTYIEISSYINKLNIIPVKLDIDLEEELQIIDLKKVQLNDYICIKKIIELAKKLYLSPIIETDLECADTPITSNRKILRFIPNIENNK